MRVYTSFLVSMFSTTVAFAQPNGETPARAAPQTSEAAPATPAGVRTHDGFYLRLATGFGAYSETIRSERSDRYGGTVKGQSTGFATLGELAVGGTIAPGLVLGGGAYTAQLIAGTFRVNDDSDGDPPPELDPEVRNFALVGPFIDWYPNPKTGFHFQAALGLATLSGVHLDTSAVNDDEPYHAIGGGVMLGVGYEWWVGDEWSMGVSARLLGSFLRGKDDSDVMWNHVAGTGPSPMFTVTYH